MNYCKFSFNKKIAIDHIMEFESILVDSSRLLAVRKAAAIGNKEIIKGIVSGYSKIIS